MPGKGRRVASRQAELGRRRRRQARGATAVDDAAPKASSRASVATVTAEDPQTQPVAAKEPAVQASPAPSSTQRNTPRARLDRPAAYNYVKPELLRISIMSGVLLAALVTLSFLI